MRSLSFARFVANLLLYMQVNWNDTQMHYTRKEPKRAYYLSLEFLMGHAFDNALLNLGLKDQYRQGVTALGFNMEDISEQERDAALGNGGLGRLAACYLDSSASQVRKILHSRFSETERTRFIGTTCLGLRLAIQIRYHPTAYLSRRTAIGGLPRFPFSYLIILTIHFV